MMTWQMPGIIQEIPDREGKKEYVHDNYQQEDLGLDDICKELGVSNSYFSSMFKKKETGNFFCRIPDGIPYG